MSKQEKLAKLLAMIEQRYFGSEVEDAMADYRRTPDDPPPRPEMPECVRHLIRLVEAQPCTQNGIAEVLDAVEAHYAQPLRLEMGKVYEDGAGEVVDIVWHDPKVANHFVGVFRRTGEPDRYRQDGSCCGGTASEKLIRRIS